MTCKPLNHHRKRPKSLASKLCPSNKGHFENVCPFFGPLLNLIKLVSLKQHPHKYHDYPNNFISCVSGFNLVANIQNVVAQTHFLSRHIPHTVSLLYRRLRSESEVKSGPPGLQIPLLSRINVTGLSQLPGVKKKKPSRLQYTHAHAHLISNIRNIGQIRVKFE